MRELSTIFGMFLFLFDAANSTRKESKSAKTGFAARLRNRNSFLWNFRFCNISVRSGFTDCLELQNSRFCFPFYSGGAPRGQVSKSHAFHILAVRSATKRENIQTRYSQREENEENSEHQPSPKTEKNDNKTRI